MKYKEVLSPTPYWKLWITHSILQDQDKILSFEEWEFKIYDISYLNDRKVTKTMNIPKIDLKRYKGLKLEWFTCFEAIELICRIEWIKMNTWRFKQYLILIWIGILILLFWIWFGSSLPNDIQASINDTMNIFFEID